MGNLKKFINSLFAIVIFALSLVTILIALKVYNINDITSIIESLLVSYNEIVIGVSVVVILLSLMALYIKDDSSDDIKSGIAIKSDSGMVYISKDTFESVIFSITKNYATLKNVKVSINIAENGVIANIYAFMMPDTVVQTLSSKLQEDIKTSILNQTTVDIKEVNLKIKGVYNQIEKKA